MELLGIPPTASFAFVTGCQLAHVTCLAAARHAVLERAVWDVESRGLAGAPPIRVVVGGKRNVTIDRALRLLGLGRESVVAASVDEQGRTSAIAVEAALRGHDSPAIVCARVGEVNTGSIDPVAEIASRIGARVRGSTSTERSACERALVPSSVISWMGSGRPTRGQPTPTSGAITCR